MAVGDGGFKQVAFGFDKNEVNEYISELRKKTKAMEEEMNASIKKKEEAEKLAEQADARIEAAVKDVRDEADKIQAKLDSEMKKTSELEEQISSLKKQLDQERAKMTDMLKSGKGVGAEAQKAYNEVMKKAEDDAKDIIAVAREQADDIIAEARERCASTTEKTDSFLDIMKKQIEELSSCYKAISDSAVELLGAEAAPVIAAAVPAVAVTAAPVSIAKDEPVAEEAPAAEESAEETSTVEESTEAAEPSLEDLLAQAENSFGVSAEEEEDEPVTEIQAAESMFSIGASSDDMPGAEKSEGDMPASFDDVWGGSELAQTIFNDEKKDAVPLVNPDARNLFGQDLFGIGSTDEDDMNSTDISADAEEEKVTEVKPLDEPKPTDAEFDSGFDQELLSQTVPSTNLGGDVSDDLLAAVKAQEESFAVKPTDVDAAALDMDMDESEDPANDLLKALQEAEDALSSIAASGGAGSVSMDDTPSAADPWGDLQKQLEAMEQGGVTGDAVFTMDEPQAAPQHDDPAAPSADDAAIWDFGGSSDSDSDDDMSSDFGGFGGF